MSSLETEKDIEVLRMMALVGRRELEARLAALETENTRLRPLVEENAELRRQVEKFQRMLFGRSSEKRRQKAKGNASQEGTTPGEDASSKGKEKPAREKKPQKGHGPRPQPALPVQEQIHELDEADETCPCCGGLLQEWHGQFEESEEITIVKRKVVPVKHKRKKFRCTCNGRIETAPGPLKLYKGARYSIDFAAQIVFDKYSMQMPLERQVREMSYDGLVIDSQTLWDYTWRVAQILLPAYDRLLQHQWSMPLLHADETTWRRMAGSYEPRGGSKLCYVWSIVSSKAVYHRIQDSRSEEAGRKVLEGFRGIVMADGYAVYPALAEDYGFTLVNCWAHVRREFLDIEKSFPKPVTEIVKLLGDLFAIEKKCPPGTAGNEPRRALRDTESRGIVERIKTIATSTSVLPQSGLGKAFKYMLDRWGGLTRFLDDPRIPLDNNAAERALRAVVVGRKNHYGSHSDRGMLAASVLYSLIDTAALEGLNPYEYLRVAIRRGLSDEDVPLPHEVAAELRTQPVGAIAA